MEITTVNVKGGVRDSSKKIHAKISEGIPIFGIHKSCWKAMGIKNIFQYRRWQRQMRKQWKRKTLK